MNSSKEEHKLFEILRLPPNKKAVLLAPLPASGLEPNTYFMKIKVNEIFDSMDSLCCREFNVAETLMLLQTPDPRIFWSWGVESKINYFNKGLLLKVNGNHHQGWVLISLSFLDLYDVYLFETGKKLIKKSVKEIYFDQLLEVADGLIEKLDNYQF